MRRQHLGATEIVETSGTHFRIGFHPFHSCVCVCVRARRVFHDNKDQIIAIQFMRSAASDPFRSPTPISPLPLFRLQNCIVSNLCEIIGEIIGRIVN